MILNTSVCPFIANSGVVLSLEEVEVGLKGLKVQTEPASLPQRQSSRGGGTPFMAEHLEEAFTGGTGAASRPRDPDMSAFNKLVSTMKASGTLPTHPKASGSYVSMQPSVMFAWFCKCLLHVRLKRMHWSHSLLQKYYLPLIGFACNSCQCFLLASWSWVVN